jgi:uncharacterized protein YdcH (DUF465 family)
VTTQTPADRETGLAHLQALKDEHRALDQRIREMDTQPWLSPEDQVELARLKKLKLRRKDEIFAAAGALGVEL